jgi:hypothetical protein
MRALFFLVPLGLLFFSCDKDEPSKTEDTYLSLTVQPPFGTENLFLDSVYTTVEGYDFKILDFKFYMTDVEFKFTVLMPHAIDSMPVFWVPIIEE